MKKKKNFLEKFVKRDYNNELEQVLEERKFDPRVKSILLSILYKIEMGYPDLVTVKRDVETKEEYIDDFIEIIKNKCNNITIINMTENTDEIPKNKTYVVNKGEKSIVSYPIERKLLYAIYKMCNNDSIVKEEYFIINRTLSELINVGYNIDKVEALRDFNGYSWTTISHEIESIDHNLVYQILRMLVGYKILDKWVKNQEFIIDYYDEFKENLQEKYGKNIGQLVNTISDISILLSIKYNSENKKIFMDKKGEIEEKQELLKDKKNFIEQTTKEKMKISEEIKRIDSIMSDKKLLENEYKKRNKDLPLEKKIFSMKRLSKILSAERDEYISNLEELNEYINPRKFVKYEKELEKKHEVLEILDVEDYNTKLDELKTQLLIIFLKCFKKNIEKAQTKNDVENLIYEMRYFLLLPFDDKKEVKDIEIIQKSVKEIEKKLMNKALEFKVMNQVSKDVKVDYSILEKFFASRAISITDVINT